MKTPLHINCFCDSAIKDNMCVVRFFIGMLFMFAALISTVIISKSIISVVCHKVLSGTRRNRIFAYFISVKIYTV